MSQIIQEINLIKKYLTPNLFDNKNVANNIGQISDLIVLLEHVHEELTSLLDYANEEDDEEDEYDDYEGDEEN